MELFDLLFPQNKGMVHFLMFLLLWYNFHNHSIRDHLKSKSFSLDLDLDGRFELRI